MFLLGYELKRHLEQTQKTVKITFLIETPVRHALEGREILFLAIAAQLHAAWRCGQLKA